MHCTICDEAPARASAIAPPFARAPARPHIRMSLVPLGAILAACLGSGAPNLLRPISRPFSVAAAAAGHAELTLSLGVLFLTLFFSGPTASDLPRTRGPLCHSITTLPRFSRSFAIPTSYLIESGSAARETQGRVPPVGSARDRLQRGLPGPAGQRPGADPGSQSANEKCCSLRGRRVRHEGQQAIKNRRGGQALQRRPSGRAEKRTVSRAREGARHGKKCEP